MSSIAHEGWNVSHSDTFPISEWTTSLNESRGRPNFAASSSQHWFGRVGSVEIGDIVLRVLVVCKLGHTFLRNRRATRSSPMHNARASKTLVVGSAKDLHGFSSIIHPHTWPIESNLKFWKKIFYDTGGLKRHSIGVLAEKTLCIIPAERLICRWWVKLSNQQ